MALIPDELITEIRERVDATSVIGEHVQLRKAGQSMKGLCPFHQERTPSFHVSPAKRTFYCFGCQKKGDVFAFLMELQGKSFIEVVHELAARCGVTIPERPSSPEETARRTERNRLLDLNALAAAWFRGALLDARVGAHGRGYLASRGIGDEIAERFQLGLAPDGWDGLVRHLEARQVDPAGAVQLGLIAPRTRPGPGGRLGFYDKFRNRLMCPVILPAGEIAGFSGRTLGHDPETPKYVNSPESPVYKKSHLLFGLHAARPAFARKGRALLVEGNFDVVALHQAGFAEAVAPLGTALTEHQVDVLRRLATTVVVCLDGDKAGRAAALRAIPLFLAAGIDARVVVLPEGEDPDSFVRAHGADALEEKIGRAPPAIDYVLEVLWHRTDRSPEQRAAALREAAPLLLSVTDEIKREILLDQLALALEVEPRVVKLAIARAGAPTRGEASPDHRIEPARWIPGGGPGASSTSPRQEEKHRPAPSLPPSELKLFAILADHPELLQEAEALGVRSLLTDERLRDMYSAAQAGSTFLDAAPSEISDLVAREVMSGSYAAVPNPRRTLVEAVRILQSERLEAEFHRLGRLVKDADRRGDRALVRELQVRQFQTRNMAEELKRRPEEEPR